MKGNHTLSPVSSARAALILKQGTNLIVVAITEDIAGMFLHNEPANLYTYTILGQVLYFLIIVIVPLGHCLCYCLLNVIPHFFFFLYIKCIK